MSVVSFQKRQIYQSVASVDEHSDEWPSTNLAEVINWFMAKASEVPLQYNSDARCEITADDCGVATIKISYYRDETPEETESRIKRAITCQAENSARQREKDLAELQRLLDIYPEYGESLRA